MRRTGTGVEKSHGIVLIRKESGNVGVGIFMCEKDADRKELTRTRKTKRRCVSRLTVGSGSAFGLDCNPRFARRILTTFLALVVAFASIPLPAIAEVADETKATIAEKTVGSNDDALAEVEESSPEPNVNSDNASLTKDSVGGTEDPAIEGDASKELKQAEPYDETEEVADHAWDKTEEGVLSSTLSAQAGTDRSFDDTSEA